MGRSVSTLGNGFLIFMRDLYLYVIVVHETLAAALPSSSLVACPLKHHGYMFLLIALSISFHMFSGIPTILASLALVSVHAQEVGRFVYSHPDDFQVYFDVYHDRMVYMMFHCKGAEVFRDGPYAFRGMSPAYHYYIDFGSKCESASCWYAPIRAGCPGVNPRSEDFYGFNYISGDDMKTTFQGQEITLRRQSFLLLPGIYVGTHMNMEMSAIVHSDFTIEIGIKCGRRSVNWAFRLDRNDGQFQYTVYDVNDAGRGGAKQYQGAVNKICRTNTGSIDFSYVVFASWFTLYSEIHGERVSFSRVKFL